MSIKERIALCRLIEKIEENKDYAKAIKVENNSTFKDRKVADKTSAKK